MTTVSRASRSLHAHTISKTALKKAMTSAKRNTFTNRTQTALARGLAVATKPTSRIWTQSWLTTMPSCYGILI